MITPISIDKLKFKRVREDKPDVWHGSAREYSVKKRVESSDTGSIYQVVSLDSEHHRWLWEGCGRVMTRDFVLTGYTLDQHGNRKHQGYRREPLRRLRAGNYFEYADDLYQVLDDTCDCIRKLNHPLWLGTIGDETIVEVVPACEIGVFFPGVG